jgi:hypothetical protein
VLTWVELTSGWLSKSYALRRLSEPVTSMAAAAYPDSAVVTVGPHGTATIWQIYPDAGHFHPWEDDAASACDAVGGGLDPDVWRRALPDVAFEQTCPAS